MLKDSLQRSQATDPSRSFIVQAPAGSGKTEILTQRFLRLLARVKAPEQIVALTFTRKAASEMRERILFALEQVAAGEKAKSAHQQQSFEYAAKALAHSQEQNWNLLEQPGRLRILTIDSLCQMIAQAIPLKEKQIPFAQICENPRLHYLQAARTCLSYALKQKELESTLTTLLHHLDNRQDQLIEFLASLLTNRELWLPFLYLARGKEKAHFEKMLVLIEQHEMDRFLKSTPKELRSTLCMLSREMAGIENDPKSLRFPLRNWLSYEQINCEILTGLASLLLTTENKIRKSFDHHLGLKRGVCEDGLYNNLKTNSKELLAKLQKENDFINALVRVKRLPEPHYDSQQWQVLQALFNLLPLLVGHLQLVFSEQNEVDFASIAQQALLALGEEDEATDLTLYLDNIIQHLLIDEFQDTSIQQFQLITKLVRGWETNDGRTLFLVGDPMQSIYRFRQAEVGLFLKAQQSGVGSVQLTALELSCNFRSTETLVRWVNQHFQSIFPQNEDIESGAIRFFPSVHVHEKSENSYVNAWQFPEPLQEAQAIVDYAVSELEHYPDDDIAILVRHRRQLKTIMSVLREREIPFQGVDIDLLAKLPHLQDLWTLTQALLLPANRLAWLSLLRSPFCGLTLNDLHKIAQFDKNKSIYHALSHLDEITNLTTEGKKRANFIFRVLREAIACRHQQTLVDWIAMTVRQLGGDFIYDDLQQNDLEQFWLLLERHTKNNILSDLSQFNCEFERLYSKRAKPSRLKIMTIHKSKGLEFDSVILPCFSAKSKNRKQPILRWFKLPSQNPENLLLVSPIKAAWQEECRLYNYLAQGDAEKDHYELQRLLYVALTRAKKRLCLFDSTEKESKGSFRSILKNQEFLEKETTLAMPKLNLDPKLLRLPIEFYLNSSSLKATDIHQSNSLITLDHQARQLGILTHELLRWICNHHPKNIEDLPWQTVINQLRSLGFDSKEQQKAYTELQRQIINLYKDPIGQWLCKPHENERNEYELIADEEGCAKTRIIDRTFIEKNWRWIIDFKTGSDEKSKQNHHRFQVDYYAKLLSKVMNEPIRCGLYYLATNHWVCWDYERLTNETIN